MSIAKHLSFLSFVIVSLASLAMPEESISCGLDSGPRVFWVEELGKVKSQPLTAEVEQKFKGKGRELYACMRCIDSSVYTEDMNGLAAEACRDYEFGRRTRP